MKFETDLYAVAKRLRLEEIDARIEHLKKDFEYWQNEYAQHGDRFAQGMYNVHTSLYGDMKRLRHYIDRSEVICMPRMVYEFPEVKQE